MWEFLQEMLHMGCLFKILVKLTLQNKYKDSIIKLSILQNSASYVQCLFERLFS